MRGQEGTGRHNHGTVISFRPKFCVKPFFLHLLTMPSVSQISVKTYRRDWGDLCGREGVHSLLEMVTSSSLEVRGPAEKTAPPHLQNFPGSMTSASKNGQLTAVQDNVGLGHHRDRP